MDHGSVHPRRGDSCVMWAKCKGYATKPHPNGAPASNLNLSGFMGGVLCIPDAEYPAFLAVFACDITAGSPQYLTECIGDGPFRANVDVDMESDAPWGPAEFDKLAAALTRAAQRLLPGVADRTLTAVLCAAPPKQLAQGSVKSGVHIVLPYLIVDRERMLCLNEVFKAELRTEFADLPDVWDAVCDQTVYRAPSSGLRMLGSHKMHDCPECKNDPARRKVCHPCVFSGKVGAGRPYAVERVYVFGAVDERLTKALRDNFALALRMASIRVAAAGAGEPRALHHMWVRFTGCPSAPGLPAHASSRSAIRAHMHKPPGAKREFKDDSKGTKKFSDIAKKLDAHDPRVRVMLMALPRLHARYAEIACKEAFELPPDDATKQRSFMLKVKGVGSQFCLNKQDDHGENSVYFVFNTHKGGSFHQRCFSRKDVTAGRIDGQCCTFHSADKLLQPSEKRLLWPETAPEKRAAADDDLILKKRR